MSNILRKLFSPRANDWGFASGFFGDFCSLRHIILEKEAIVENVAGTTLDRIAPTKDLLRSSESLLESSKGVETNDNIKRIIRVQKTQ